jgi:hypothetical protein
MSGEEPPYNPYLGGMPTTQKPDALDPESVQEAMREAQSRPLDFDPATRSKYIKDNVQDIQAMIAADATVEEIRAKYGAFANSHPELFRKLISGEDMSNLTSMLAMMDQMAQGNLSHHQASMIVGTRLAERYLPHNLKPSQQGAKRGGRR